jgi:hypothetical protein
MSADERIAALESQVSDLRDEAVALRIVAGWLLGFTVNQAHLPMETWAERVAEAVRDATLASNANRGQMLRVQSRVLALLDSALP